PGPSMTPRFELPNVYCAGAAKQVVSYQARYVGWASLPLQTRTGLLLPRPTFATSPGHVMVFGNPVRKVVTPLNCQPPKTSSRMALLFINCRLRPKGRS